jgi:YHS domain-containing protein
VLGGIYWLHRNSGRFGGGQGFARDPVCGMQVEKANPGAVLREHGQTTYFCSDHCKERYPGRDLGVIAAGAHEGYHNG